MRSNDIIIEIPEFEIRNNNLPISITREIMNDFLNKTIIIPYHSLESISFYQDFWFLESRIFDENSLKQYICLWRFSEIPEKLKIYSFKINLLEKLLYTKKIFNKG